MGPGRAVLVTGAAKGIGEACVKRLAAGGFRVFAGVRSDADGERLRENCGAAVIPVRLDVTDEAQIAAAAATVASLSGDTGLAGIVNNAGIAVGGPLEFLPLPRLRQQFEVNVMGQVAVTQAMLPLLRRSGGRIVFIGSISGLSALPFTGAYAASKHALEAIADAWRVELRPWSIDVVLIEPGTIATPIWVTSLAEADRMAGELPAESETYYGRLTDGVRRRALTAAKGMRGLPADGVARVVEKALTTRRPRTRYKVGHDARLRFLMRRLLPDRAMDAVIARTIERLASSPD